MARVFDYLDEVRARPESARRRILWWSTTLITAVIVGVWLLSWGLGNKPATASTAPSPGLRESFKQIPERIKTGWQILLKN